MRPSTRIIVVLNPISITIAKAYGPLALSCLLVLLLGASAFVPPASGQPPVWRTSSDLIKKSPQSFSRLDKAGIEAVLKRVDKSFTLIPDYLRDKDTPVFQHKGDLTIDGSFDNSHILVVDGNLTVRGSYDDYRDGTGILVVLGDMRAEHVISWGSIAVNGTLQTAGLVYAYYNDFTFEVGGPVKARALVVFDKSTKYDRVEAAVVQTDNDNATKVAVRHFVPELMIEDVLDKTEADTTELYAVPSYEDAQKRIGAGRPIFRDQPGPESLAADIIKLYQPKVDAATMMRLAKTDRLLAMVVATKESVPVDVQNLLAATGDPAILELLAKNPKIDRAVLGRIAKTNAATAVAVARNPNAPAEAISLLASAGDPATRIAILENPSVPVADLSRLAVDKDASVRKALAQGRHLRRVPAADLTRLISDPESEVRGALPHHDGVLGVEQLAVLARDKNPKVRQAVGEALSRQSLWQQVPMGTPDARAALISALVKDAVPEVRKAALLGATAAEQEQFVANYKADEQLLVIAELAEVTRSVPLMTRAAEAPQDIAVRLAKNLAIPPALQLRLISRLQDPKSRTRVSMLDYEALAKAMESWDLVIDALVNNPNVTEEARLAVARYCRASTAQGTFCREMLGSPHDASAEVFEILSGVGDSEDWALSAILSKYPTRAQIERAVPRWFNTEPVILAEFKKIRTLNGDAFWNALATSKQPKLRAVAAANAATPAATLVTLLRDPETDVSAPAAANPSTPVESLTQAGHISWILSNPRIPDARVRSLLDRALADADDSGANACKKVLAARALRAAS
jgi:hypothetical protein